jgi:hypothetical protein
MSAVAGFRGSHKVGVAYVASKHGLHGVDQRRRGTRRASVCMPSSGRDTHADVRPPCSGSGRGSRSGACIPSAHRRAAGRPRSCCNVFGPGHLRDGTAIPSMAVSCYFPAVICGRPPLQAAVAKEGQPCRRCQAECPRGRAEILETYARYSWGLDLADPQMLLSAFAADGEFDHLWQGKASGHDAILATSTSCGTSASTGGTDGSICSVLRDGPCSEGEGSRFFQSCS